MKPTFEQLPEAIEMLLNQQNEIFEMLKVITPSTRLTRKQASKILQVSEQTIDNYRDAGKLTNVGIGAVRFDLKEVLKLK